MTYVLCWRRDLQVSGLVVNPSSGVQSGNQVTIVWNDSNTGFAATSGAWYDHVQVANGAQSLLDTYVYYDPMVLGSGNVAVGGQHHQSLPLTLPNGPMGAGPITVTVTTNAFHQLYEYNGSNSGFTNNTSTTSFNSALGPYPDLVVTSPAKPKP